MKKQGVKKLKEKKMPAGSVVNWQDFIEKRLNIEDFVPALLSQAFYSDGTETFTIEFCFPHATKRFATLVSKLDDKYVDHWFTIEEAEAFIQKGAETLEYVGLGIFDKSLGRDGLVWNNLQYTRAEISAMGDQYVKAFKNAPKQKEGEGSSMKILNKDGN